MLRKNRNRFGHDPGERIKLGCHNYCEFGIMSRCTAGNTWEEQRVCKFSRRSSTGDWCMHYRKNMGGHCDCVKAQKELSQMTLNKCRNECDLPK